MKCGHNVQDASVAKKIKVHLVIAERRAPHQEVLREIETWMDEHEYASIAQIIGNLSQQHCAEPAAFEHANSVKVISRPAEVPA